MKPDFLGMLLNPFTIARENATCKTQGSDLSTFTHAQADISAATAVAVLDRLGKKTAARQNERLSEKNSKKMPIHAREQWNKMCLRLLPERQQEGQR